MKLNRKLVMILALVLSLAMATGGTLAYLTDRESIANVFTVGNVSISLTEENFDHNAKLLPGVEIQKDPVITNTGSENAYVWMTVSVPTDLVPALKMTGLTVDNDKWIDHATSTEILEGYTTYVKLYEDELAPGAKTDAGLTKVQLNEFVDVDPNGDWYLVNGGNATKLGNWNNASGNPVIYVSAYAIQAQEFDNGVEEAYAAYNTQWGDNGNEFGAVGFAGGNGTQSQPYLIKTADQLANISNYAGSYNYFKLADGVKELDMTDVKQIVLNGSFDGNGATLKNLTSSLFYQVGVSDKEQDIKISNFTANVNNTDGHGLVRNILNPGTTTFENVTIHGYIEGLYNLGSFYNYGTANSSTSDGANYKVVFKNAKSDATIVCTSGNGIGGMLGHGYQGNGFTQTIEMDANSGYTGKMYTTNGAKGDAVMAMNSTGKYILNNKEVNTGSQPYTTSKIDVVKPVLGGNGYTVEPVTGATRYVVYLNAQCSAHKANGDYVPNKNGMTWTLGKTETTDLTGKVFDKITSATIVNDTNDDFGYDLKNGVLTIYSGRSDNYASGMVRLQVNQYNADNELLATGTVDLYKIEY